MKTRSVTISAICFVLATLSVNAQSGNEFKSTNLLPYLLDSVVSYGPKSFEKIRGEAKNGNNYVSLLTVEGAEKTYIREKTYNYEWVADYGLFKSFEAAKSKLDELKQQFVGIAPNAQFIEIRPKFAEYPDYVLKVNLPNNCIRFYNAKYSLSTNKKSNFLLEFIVTGKQGRPSFVDYVPIMVAPATNQFAQDLRDLMMASVTRFDSIQGEQISDNLTRNFKTTKKLDEAISCTIEKPLFGSSYFALMTTGKTQEQLDSDYRKVVEKVGTALGSDFFYSLSKSGDGIDFTNKNRLSHESVPDVSVQVVNENGGYSIYVVVRQVEIF